MSSSPVSETIQQPPWHEPKSESKTAKLHVFNTLTRTKVPFVTKDGSNRLTWYNCGPTVYDAAHLGHARNYVTFDIIRRIIQDYFNYDILYIMNITDIDDKIILRARQAFLFKEFARENPTVSEGLKAQLKALLADFVSQKFSVNVLNNEWHAGLKEKLAAADDAKGLMHLDAALKAQSAVNSAQSNASSADLLDAFQDILSPHLDALKGSTVNDPRISRELAAYWENDFLIDMQQLNVLPPDVMTRVSEYIPEIIEYVEGIMKNGFAYVTNEGSVYFDVAAFKGCGHHHYAKLCPWNAGNPKLFEEGEGALGMKLGGKRDPRDFALWKASKPGEPFWASPWGQGRPGWHIECSAMAGAVSPGTLDIHSGGIDLAFPHHDNELAQAEAYSGCCQWVNYFLHAGHVHIEGHKMSKSLKNFITVKDCLQRYTARQMRIMFLQHQWNAPLTFKESSMVSAISAEATLVSFFANLNVHVAEYRQLVEGENNFGSLEKELLRFAHQTQDRVHNALCDSFDTPSVMSALFDLINKANVYMKEKGANAAPDVLKFIGGYVAKMLNSFGVTGLGLKGQETQAASVNEARLQGILDAVGAFRDSVRIIAKKADCKPKDFFVASDELRSAFAKLGVVFEDRADGLRSVVKLLDTSVAADGNENAEEDLSAQTAALSLKQQQAERAAAKAAKAQIHPSKLFIDNPAYSKFDENGVPTHAADGQELSKSARKKALKEYDQQVELYAKFNNN